jgi:hypothetical protein
MTKITEAQRELLSSAAANPEGVVDAPEDAKISRPLIRHRLAISLPVTGGASQFMITTAGRALLGESGGASEDPAAADEDSVAPADQLGGEGASESQPTTDSPEATASGEQQGAEAEATDETAPADVVKPLPGGKLGKLVEVLQRPNGATLEEMVAATGRQAHSVRGAMSGGLKKKQGLAITSTKTDGTRVYRINTGEAA